MPFEMAVDFDADIEELRKLLESATRPRVQKLLREELDILLTADRTKAASATPPTSSAEPAPVVSNQESAPSASAVAPPLSAHPVLLDKTSAPPPIEYSPLHSFAWDQEGDKVKVYISIEGAAQDKVKADFSTQSFDVRIHGVDKKNFRFGIPKLHKAVHPEQCKAVVKPKRIIVTLKKKEKTNWTDLSFKEDKFKPKVSPDGSKDPMAGIMDLMKNMYDEGDDDMKRSIAQAWTKSRAKGADPSMGGGFGDGDADFP
eukprot:TRINITY_DN38406_c0_g1_i1.p1 TRINITY_DN38406_c0_g1~~TRINITY_DN38406_c0_g1_i1.p1  ORF type:complete len:258 (-),score=62.44 TRINITY_DN38406_c0_g1_i1:785-1558(-)